MAILVVCCLTILLVGAGMVVDLGLVRVDRQVNKSAADAATIAGLHALNSGDTRAHPFSGVCTAVRFLRENADRFAGMSDTSGTWTTGTGAIAANGCTDIALRNQVCIPGNKGSWARFVWTGSSAGAALSVTFESGYQLGSSTGWPEDALPAAVADSEDSAQGCDQLAVTVTQNRKPGFGSLATSSDLVTSVRSVGRVKTGPGGYAPAMLLLKRTGCPALQVGATGGGANSFVHVFGAVSSNGLAQPGTIHTDTDGSGCSGSSGNWILYGKAADGIVTYAAPLVSNPSAADPTKPGTITTAAGANGVALGTIRDAASSVYGSAALDAAGASGATKSEPTGRAMITRKPVDDRYLTGVRSIVSNAQTNVFGLLTAANAASFGYVTVTCSAGSVASLPALTATSKLFVDCANLKSIPVVNAGTVVFSGQVSPSAVVSMPNATGVYIFGGGDAISLGTGGEFHMHTAGNTDAAGLCTSGAVASDKAVVVVKDGGIKQTGGALQMCRTTMVMMGGRADGCVPATNGTAPTQTPCGGTMGTGQLGQNGGSVDWTAPDSYDVMTLANGDADPAVSPAWSDSLGPEDLAFWSESAANNVSTKANMGGGAVLHVSGVFMTPNYDPFTIGGNGEQNLTNAQYVVTSLALSGAVQLKMSVDPNSAVQVGKQSLVGLVR